MLDSRGLGVLGVYSFVSFDIVANGTQPEYRLPDQIAPQELAMRERKADYCISSQQYLYSRYCSWLLWTRLARRRLRQAIRESKAKRANGTY